MTVRYGTIGIFIAAFSPIPYKVFGWAAGMGDMKIKPFIIAGFGLEAVLIGIYGQKALDGLWWLLDREMLIGVLLIITALFAWLGIRWWNNLSLDPNLHE